MGLRPLADNSFFTHLATGRLILEQGGVPTVDPYTFTAVDAPWVVQSWLASWLYATVEALTGSTGLRVLSGTIAGAVAGLIWTLARPAPSIVVRFLLCTTVLVASASLWAERPFMIGLLGLALVVLAGEGRLDARWLLPVGWVWANAHGSFPLGLAYLGALGVGARLDRRSAVHERSSSAWLAAGIVFGVVGPLGLSLLKFPIDLLQQQDILKNVTEWRAPTFQTTGQRVFLVQTLVAVVLLVRRPSYRAALPYVAFVALALSSVRNVPVASLVLVPLMATAAPPLGGLKSSDRGLASRLLLVLAVVLAVGIGSARLSRPDFSFGRYPIDAMAYLEQTSIDLSGVHLAAPDIAGNVRELLYGAEGDVFYDDRFDMFPAVVTYDHLALVNGGPRTQFVLDRYDVDLVLWKRGGGSTTQLVADPAWRVLFSDEGWVLLCRRSAGLGGALGEC